MLIVEDMFDRLMQPKTDAAGLEIALLLERLCRCSLNDDEDGVAACSALLEHRLNGNLVHH